MKKAYWISGIVAIGLSATVASVVVAKPFGHCCGAFKAASMDFDKLDVNQDGKVTKAEMAARKQARFKEADVNGDGLLSAEEIADQAAKRARAKQLKRAKHMIVDKDANEDGLLSAEEFGNSKRQDKLFERLDADKDGAVSAEEFANGQARMGKRHKGWGWKKRHGCDGASE